MCSSTVTTKAELARRLGVCQPTVRRWTKHPEWRFGPNPPYDVGKVRKWRADTLPVDSAAGHRAEATAEADAERVRRLVETLVVLRDADPQFWTRCIIGVIAELQTVFVGAPDSHACSDEEREAFYGVVRAEAARREKMKTLRLPTVRECEQFMKSL